MARGNVGPSGGCGSEHLPRLRCLPGAGDAVLLKQRGMDGRELKCILQQRGIQPTVLIGLMLVKITVSKTFLPGKVGKFQLVRRES